MREGWKACQLGDVCTLQRGFDLPKKNRAPGQVPLMSSSGAIDFHNEAKVLGPGVVTGRSGSIGNVFYVDDDFWPLNTTLYVKDFHGNYPRFVYYLLLSFKLDRFSSGAGVPTLNRNSVHREEIEIPETLEEQKRIVVILDDLSTETARLEAIYHQQLSALSELRQSLLHKAFSGELTANAADVGDRVQAPLA